MNNRRELLLKHIFLVGSLVTFAVGCSGKPEPLFRISRGGSFTTTQESADSFAPLVSPSTATPRCEDLRNVPAWVGVGARALSLIYGDPPDRRVTVFLDADDDPTSYSDMRGDLSTSDDHQGDFTSITLNLVGGYGFGLNRPASGEPQSMRFALDDALSSATLDHPQAMLERVLSTCG